MDSLKVLLYLALISASTGAGDVHVAAGENVHLECQGPENAKIILLEWKRDDLLSDGYVFFYLGDRPHKNLQHPIFKDRVELRDPQMKNGDVSITLYNTTINDTGTYECRIVVGDTADSSSTASEIKREISLVVVAPPGPGGGGSSEGGGRNEETGFSNGFIGLLMALGFSTVTLVVLAIAVMIPKRITKKNKIAAVNSAGLV